MRIPGVAVATWLRHAEYDKLIKAGDCRTRQTASALVRSWLRLKLK